MKIINGIKKIIDKIDSIRNAFVEGFKDGFEKKWNQTKAKTKYGIESPIHATTTTVNDAYVRASIENQIRSCSNQISLSDMMERFGK